MPDALFSPVFVRFGQPKHGWLPVAFEAGAFHLEFYASHIPANPIESLCEALAVVPAGGSARVMWNLEPAVYWFAFENLSGEITLEITEAPGHNQPGTCVLSLTGNTRTILRPFYRALTVLATSEFSEAHWPVLAASKLKQIGQLLRSQH
jgi:hypothetical protein